MEKDSTIGDSVRGDALQAFGPLSQEACPLSLYPRQWEGEDRASRISVMSNNEVGIASSPVTDNFAYGADQSLFAPPRPTSAPPDLQNMRQYNTVPFPPDMMDIRCDEHYPEFYRCFSRLNPNLPKPLTADEFLSDHRVLRAFRSFGCHLGNLEEMPESDNESSGSPDRGGADSLPAYWRPSPCRSDAGKDISECDSTTISSHTNTTTATTRNTSNSSSEQNLSVPEGCQFPSQNATVSAFEENGGVASGAGTLDDSLSLSLISSLAINSTPTPTAAPSDSAAWMLMSDPSLAMVAAQLSSNFCCDFKLGQAQQEAAVEQQISTDGPVSSGNVKQTQGNQPRKMDQAGCRMLQKKLEKRCPEVIDEIFGRCQPILVELMTDPFGNYLAQKLFEVCRPEHLTWTIERASHSLVHVAKNVHGTRAVQKLVEMVTLKVQKQRICDILRPCILSLINDVNGNHVVQKCLSRFESSMVGFIYGAVARNVTEVATNRHGCCVLQRCLDTSPAGFCSEIIRGIIFHASDLVFDAFGNYAVQYVLDRNSLEANVQIVRHFRGKLQLLSKQKFASNVVEKCLQLSYEAIAIEIIEELLLGGPNLMKDLLSNNYGNYVVQKALSVAKEPKHSELLGCVRPILDSLRQSPSSRRVFFKLVKKYPSLSTNSNSSNKQQRSSRRSNSSGNSSSETSSLSNLPSCLREQQQRQLSTASIPSFPLFSTDQSLNVPSPMSTPSSSEHQLSMARVFLHHLSSALTTHPSSESHPHNNTSSPLPSSSMRGRNTSLNWGSLPSSSQYFSSENFHTSGGDVTPWGCLGAGDSNADWPTKATTANPLLDARLSFPGSSTCL